MSWNVLETVLSHLKRTSKSTNSPLYYYNNINTENNHISLGLAQWEVYSVKWKRRKKGKTTQSPHRQTSRLPNQRKAEFARIRNFIKYARKWTNHLPGYSKLSIFWKLKITIICVWRPVALSLNKFTWETSVKCPCCPLSTKGVSPEMTRVMNTHGARGLWKFETNCVLVMAMYEPAR